MAGSTPSSPALAPPSTEDALLPVGIAESLPASAGSLARNATRLIELYQSWGYELVSPPMVERASVWQQEADLRRESIQFPDQLSGEQLSLRSDITPQIMRVVAHRLKPQATTRLCYHGEVLRARAHGAHDTRNAQQIGAEHIGSGGVLESIWLLRQSLVELGFRPEHLILSLGQALIWQRLLAIVQADNQQRLDFHCALGRKDFAACERSAHELTQDKRLRRALAELPHCYGGVEVLDKIDALCQNLDTELSAALAELRSTAQALPAQTQIHIDIAQIPSYSYHTGMVFSAHSPQVPYPLGRGGAYAIRSVGYSSAASGFSVEINKLIRWQAIAAAPAYYLAPSIDVYLADADLRAYVDALRARGERVVHAGAAELATPTELANCCGRIVRKEASWTIQPPN